MYSVKNVLDKNPIQLSGFVILVVNFAILMHWIVMTSMQVAGLNGVLVSGLGLFVSSKTANKATLEEMADPPQGDEPDVAA